VAHLLEACEQRCEQVHGGADFIDDLLLLLLLVVAVVVVPVLGRRRLRRPRRRRRKRRRLLLARGAVEVEVEPEPDRPHKVDVAPAKAHLAPAASGGRNPGWL